MPNSTQKIGETKPHSLTLTLSPAAGERGLVHSPARVFECRGVLESRVKIESYYINTLHQLTPSTRRLASPWGKFPTCHRRARELGFEVRKLEPALAESSSA
jgi:hypothetical protein